MAYRPLLLTSPMLRGSDVTALQQLIKAYDPAPGGGAFVDGIFGVNTRDALIAFQKANMDTRNLGVAMPDFQARYKLPVPVNAQPAPSPVSASPTPAPETFEIASAAPRASVNWGLWLSIAGLGFVGYLAFGKKGKGFF